VKTKPKLQHVKASRENDVKVHLNITCFVLLGDEGRKMYTVKAYNQEELALSFSAIQE
jgi:hypothetical protein